ncbi:MAG: restriction endonuclease subunit S [Kluyvera ascorbata]
MGNKFSLTTLDMIAEVIDSRHKTPNYTESGYPMVRVVDIKGGELDLKDTKRVAKDIYEDFSKGRSPQAGDLIISRVGSYGNISYVSGNEKFCLGQNTAFIIPNEKNNYLYYALISPFVQQQIEDMAVGAVQKTISLKSIKNLNIPFPNLDIRNAISKTMRSIDTRISINHKINIQLEQMSQTLFKSWFVDFDPVIDNALDAGNPIPEALQSRAELRQKVRNSADFKPLPADIRALFPVEFEETELGWVPKGWITTSFNDLIELIGGGTPKTSVEEYWNGDIPWFSVVDAPNESDVYVLTTEKNITTEGLNNSSTKLLRKGTIIISARGTVGKCAMVAVPMAMNQSCYGVIGKNNISDEYIYFQLKNAVQALQQIGHGSVFNTITRDTFKNIKIPFCNEELTNSYSLLVKNYFSKILNNNYQNIALTNLRDTLLPKLISGELSLEDLPDLVDQTEPA